MLQQLGTAAEVCQVVAAKYQNCRADPFLEIFAGDCPRGRTTRSRHGRPLGESQTRRLMTREPRWSPASPAAIESPHFHRSHGPYPPYRTLLRPALVERT